MPLTVDFVDLSTGNPTAWNWTFGDGGTSAERNPTHTYSAVGTYAVSLTASNAGGSTTATDAIAIYRFVGPLKPISADGSAEFRKRPNVPVRFQLTAADGSFVKTADAKLFVALVGPSGAVGDYLPAVSDDYAGNAFIYDTKAHYYEFPLATRDMSGGIWSLRFTVNGAVAEEVGITLIKK
jgi:PKD repeat protein